MTLSLFESGSCVLSAEGELEKISICQNFGCGRWMVRKKIDFKMKKRPSENSSDEEQSEDEESHQNHLEQKVINEFKGDFVLAPEEMLYILQIHAQHWMCWKEYFSSYIAKDKQLTRECFVYKFYRQRGWTVKRGCKFGAHFLLYKDSPEVEHSLFTVQIVGEDKSLSQWNDVISAVRSARQVKKVSLFVRLPKEYAYSPECYQNLEGFELKEILLRRWKCDGKQSVINSGAF
jgi:tRNA-intron lyase